MLQIYHQNICGNELGEEKNFEVSVTELVEYAVIVICIYRSPDGIIDTFFNKLQMIIQKQGNTKL